jgi:arylsulfatase A-like enzyme
VTTTNSFALTMAYDDMKVAAIVNEINGLDHTGKDFVGVPALFGMNFQAVSVGQKLAIGGVVGGYVDANGTPSAALQATLEHTDASIGAIVSALEAQRLADSTMIIITAKHANSPVDPAALVCVNPAVISTIVNSVAPGLLALLSADTGPLIWLKDQTRTAEVVAALEQPANLAAAHTAQVLWGNDLRAFFPDPLTDSRTPDIILMPKSGTVYTTSLTKIADHGGFGDDDVRVGLLVSQPSMSSKTINDRVETRQIACTILKALALSCDDLDSQQMEPSTFLPHSNHDRNRYTRAVASVRPKR